MYPNVIVCIFLMHLYFGCELSHSVIWKFPLVVLREVSSSTLDFQYWGLDKELHSAHPAAALLVGSLCLCSEGPP